MVERPTRRERAAALLSDADIDGILSQEVEPRCDICSEPEDHEVGMIENDWNGETGCHLSCEARRDEPNDDEPGRDTKGAPVDVYAVAVGNAFDGMKIYGPFLEGSDEALLWVEGEGLDADWHIVLLTSPEEEIFDRQATSPVGEGYDSPAGAGSDVEAERG